MERRSFIKTIGLGSTALLFSSGFQLYGLDPYKIQKGYSLGLDFMMSAVQRIVCLDKLLIPQNERILINSTKLKESGNAFWAGKYFNGDLEELRNMSEIKMAEVPSDPWARYQMAYYFGSKTANAINNALTEIGFGDYLTDKEKSIEFDAAIIETFFLKRQMDNELGKEAVKEFLNACMVRTFIRYHTLKAHQEFPLEWVENTVRFRNNLQIYFDELSEMMFANTRRKISEELINPSDPLLLKLSFANHRTDVSHENLKDIGALGSSALSKGIIAGVQTLVK